MVIVDHRGTIRLVNAQVETLFGYQREELLGHPVQVLLPGLFGGKYQAHPRQDVPRVQVRRLGARLGLSGLRRDGSEFPVEVSLSSVQTRAGLLAPDRVRDVTGQQTGLERVGEPGRALQRQLTGSPPGVPGIVTAIGYLPGGAEAGGDWFDLVALGAKYTGVVIGEVMGSGLQAATLMGRLRPAANALARTGMPPRQLMDVLEDVVADLPGELVSCCYLIISATRGEVTAASAGQPPVLVVQPDGAIDQLPVPASVPLGAGGVPHRQDTLPVAHGSTLVLHTNGLVAARRMNAGTLERELQPVFSTAPSLQQAADRILALLLPDSSARAGDVTLLLARMPAAPLATVTRSLEPRPEQVAAGRRFVRDVLTGWQQAELADTACLLASEILTNAVGHARQAVTLRLHYMADEIITEVADDYSQLPRRISPEPDDEFGRGLTLVDALASSWGALPAGTGKMVWFSLATGEQPGARPLADGLAAASTHAAHREGTGSSQAARQWGDASSGTEQPRCCCWHCRSR